MQNSNFNPISVNDFDKNKVSSANKGVETVATAGASTNLDLTLTDDVLLTGLQVIAQGSVFGDNVDLQVLMGSTVVAQFGTSIYLPSDEDIKLNEEAKYPAKIPAGLTLRLIYNSIGMTNVPVAVNYRLHKVLV